MQLKKIAYKMRRFADVNPRKEGQPFDPARYRVELGGGLRIVLYVDEERHWHLIAYRQGTFPGEVEMETVRRDFEVPEPNQESREIVPDGAPEAEQWHLVRLTWPERIEQPALLEVPEPPAKYF